MANRAGIHCALRKSSKDEEQKEKSDDQELYESLRALLERARATIIRLTDERDRLEGVSMKAAQSALRDARSTVEQLRKEEAQIWRQMDN